MQQQLKLLFDCSNKVERDKQSSILSVLGRSYDEDLISRLVAYCLSSDYGLVKKLVENYANKQSPQVDIDVSIIKDITVFTEKNMGMGRADIFATLMAADGRLITITIENKIYSYEHKTDERFQTQVYCDWVIHHPQYAGAYNVFYYLKPDYNDSWASCTAFENITYAEILKMLSESNDPIIQDFKRHIEYALKGDDIVFDHAEKLLLDNYEAFEEIRAEASKKVKMYQDMLLQKVVDGLGQTIVDWRKMQAGQQPDLFCEKVHYGAGIGSYRLYRGESERKWYQENEHYFYVEIKFENGCLNQIKFQCTLRDDEKGKNEHKVHQFLYSNPDIRKVEVDGRYYVIEQKGFAQEDWGTDAWEQQFVASAVQHLSEYITRMDQVFERYQEFKKLR